MHKDTNTAVNTCPSCQTKFAGKFCSNCGEKAFHESDYKIKKFLEQTVEIFTHFDSKFVRSVKYIFTRPGFLTEQNMHGIRVKYAKPMQIFLLANIFFFLLTNWTGVTDYTPNLLDYKYGAISDFFIFKWLRPLDNWVVDQISVLASAKSHHFGLSEDEFSRAFWLNSHIYSKSFLVLIIPFSAIIIYLFYKKRFKYFTGSLLFSAHLVSFQLIIFAIVSIFTTRYQVNIYQPIEWLFYKTPLKPITEFFFLSDFELDNLLLWIPYLFFAFRRLFPTEHPIITFIKAYLISRILYFMTFIFYKKILIVFTLLLMH